MSLRSGRCLCGAVQFELSGDPLTCRVCWCRDCQHLAPNGTVNLMVRSETLTVRGSLASYTRHAASGNEVACEFCSTCGSQLFARVASRPQFCVVRAGNLDDPSSVRPVSNIWADSAPAWACLDEALQRVAAQPPPPGTAPR